MSARAFRALATIGNRSPAGGVSVDDGGRDLAGGRSLDDGELVERARSGDPRAYEELVRRYQALAFRTAYLILGSAADAEDSAQEGFVRAYYALPRFRAGSPFRPWLLQIVANEARNRRRSSGRRDALALRVAALTPDATPSPEAAALATDERAALLAALGALRPDDRDLLTSRYFLELPEAELAQILNCPRGTVKSRLSRALGRLRTLLQRDPTIEPPAGRARQRGHDG